MVEYKHKGLVTAVVICFLLALCSAAWPGVEPSPFKTKINKLNAVSQQLESIYNRLQEALTTPPKNPKSAPKNVLGKLGGATHQLTIIDRRIENLLSSLPLNAGDLPTEVTTALHKVERMALTISTLASDSIKALPGGSPVADSLRGVMSFAISIGDLVVAYIHVGHEEIQTLYTVNVFPQPLCNDDGEMCSQVSLQQVKDIMDGTNSLMYRSNSTIRTRLAPSLTVIPDVINETVLNGNCDLFPGISVTTMEINGYMVEVLAMGCDDVGADTKCGIIRNGDRNGDGVTDEASTLCEPFTSSDLNDVAVDLGKSAQNDFHAAEVLLRYGTKRVYWDAENSVWRHERISGGGSSGLGSLITITNNMGNAGGNGFSHELGHYLASFHPFEGGGVYYDPKSEIPVDDQLRTRIEAAWESLCSASPDQCDPRLVVKGAFDHDDEITYDCDKSENWADGVASTDACETINQMPITDTPADPGESAWAAHFGEGEACKYENQTITIDMDGTGYDIQPDRTNIMSYFKTCFPREAHFSARQIDRSETAVKYLHRQFVTDPLDVKTWRNSNVVRIRDNKYGVLPADFDPNNVPLDWATTKILVNDSEGDTSARAVVGVKIYQPVDEEGITIELIDPDGIIHTLQQPDQNKPRVNASIRTLFYLNTPLRNGLWRLRVAEKPSFGPTASDHDGYIDDWQLQFENL